MAKGPLRETVTCDACGTEVARFELLPPKSPRRGGPEHELRDMRKHWIYVWNFERSGDSAISPEEYERVSSAIEARDWGSLEELDWRHTVFWCRKCDRCYCGAHWQIEGELEEWLQARGFPFKFDTYV